MDRIQEITDKYEKNGVESLTPEEAEFILNKLNKNLNSLVQWIRLDRIATEYYTQKDDLDKIIEVCYCEFNANEERLSGLTFSNYMKNKSIQKVEGLDNPFVHRYLGGYYDSHCYIDDSYEEKAKEHWEKGAEQGSYFCAQHLYDYYLKDRNGKKPTKDDFEKAIHFAKMCLNSNQLMFSSFSCNDLFIKMEESDILTEEERKKINDIILESKELLYCKAEYYRGRYREYKFKNDLDLCIYWGELSASKGSYKAYELLGDIYSGWLYHNEFEDYKKALYYYEKGKIYYRIVALIEELIETEKIDLLEDCSIESFLAAANDFNKRNDYEFAKICYEKAAEQGDAIALKELGIMYEDGIGVEQDYKKAFEYYEQAAKRGNAIALSNLGYMYQHGEGVEQDYKKAIEYYTKAVEKGDAFAQNNLGRMYYLGLGVEHDSEKAIELFKKAAKQGIKNSKKMIMRYNYAHEEKIDYAELFFWEESDHEDDPYFEKIRKMIDDGKEVISVKSLTDLSKNQIPGELHDNNKIKDYIMKSILGFLNERGDSTIINVRYINDLSSVTLDFYTIPDLRKIVYVCKKFLEGIDLNQSQEDVFMQIYIKLGLMISYDYDVTKQHKKEKRSTSGNLMTFLNKKGVCQGYAMILKNMLDIVGIKSNILYSRKDEGGDGHAYNQVKINGKWYYCDLTGDNTQIKRNEKMAFCLKSRESFVTDLYHDAIDKEQEHESNEDYSNVQRLFWKNRFKLFKNNFRAPLEQLIEPAGIKEEGGRSR